MKTRNKTLQAGASVTSYILKKESEGWHYLGLGRKRVPNGTTEKIVINIKRWRGGWGGWQVFRGSAVLYK